MTFRGNNRRHIKTVWGFFPTSSRGSGLEGASEVETSWDNIKREKGHLHTSFKLKAWHELNRSPIKTSCLRITVSYMNKLWKCLLWKGLSGKRKVVNYEYSWWGMTPFTFFDIVVTLHIPHIENTRTACKQILFYCHVINQSEVFKCLWLIACFYLWLTLWNLTTVCRIHLGNVLLCKLQISWKITLLLYVSPYFS